VVLVLNMALVSFARTAYSHEHGHAHRDVCVTDDVLVQTKLSEGSVIWKYEDYARWFSAARLSETDQDRLSWERTQGESPTILIMTSADYQKWVSSLDPDIARVVEENAVRVRVSELPSSIAVQRFEDGLFVEDTMAPSEGEYVIIDSLLEICIWCGWVVVVIAEHYFKGSKWVMALRILALTLEFVKICTECGGLFPKRQLSIVHNAHINQPVWVSTRGLLGRMVTGLNVPVNVEHTGTNGSDNWALKELSC